MVGRDKEIQLLQEAMRDDASHFVAVYGRRRVGKTYLIRETFDYRFTFQHAGVSAGGKKEQLQAFSSSLKDAGYVPKKKFTNWLEAFDALKDVVRQSTEQKKIIFIDELSWMDSQKSDLIAALENFWNGFASARRDILLIVCTSATSWMLSKVVHNKGGLYHRLTEQIHLQPFALKQCEDYVKAVGLALNRDQILQYYAIFGGVPYYWSFLKKGLSLSQNVDAILFAKDAPLRDEFQYLYAAIFRKPEIYVKIIETLATKKSGMTRTELIGAARITNSGDLTIKLEELESCGFIRKYQAFGRKKKSAVYQLMDFFTLFYYRFLKEKPTDEHFWINQLNTPVRNVWMGNAFERICLAHVDQIKKALGISGVLTQVNSLYCNSDPEHGIFGSQIDLLIVRKDQVINLCEMKYSGTEYTITEKTSQDMNRKISDLVSVTGTKYAIYPTWITTYGLVNNAYASDVQAVITMEDLFRDV